MLPVLAPQLLERSARSAVMGLAVGRVWGCLNAKSLDKMKDSLLSVSEMCERLGITMVVRPAAEGESYFRKDDWRIPIQYYDSRRLYYVQYTYADSSAAVRRANKT